MNLENLSSADYPFKHWEISSCLDAKTLNEISYSNIPDGDRAYDGTRAADHSGKGLDGKLRLFLDLENCKYYPNLTKVINELQKKDIYTKIGNFLNKDRCYRNNHQNSYPKSTYKLMGSCTFLCEKNIEPCGNSN